MTLEGHSRSSEMTRFTTFTSTNDHEQLTTNSTAVQLNCIATQSGTYHDNFMVVMYAACIVYLSAEPIAISTSMTTAEAESGWFSFMSICFISFPTKGRLNADMKLAIRNRNSLSALLKRRLKVTHGH